MKILFIGGNGNISWYCAKYAIEAGHDVYILNRGVSAGTRRATPNEATLIHADIRDAAVMQTVLENNSFDIVADFICFNKEHAATSLSLFSGKIKQYFYISSCAVYQKDTQYLPYKETSPLHTRETTQNEYVHGKIDAENVFLQAFHAHNFPVTILRPSYTYDTIFPVLVGHNCFTAPQRYLDGHPVFIAGDGEHLGTFTHSKDFARAFTGLLGNPEALGETFHITSDEWLTWNEVMRHVTASLGITQPKYIHVPVDTLLQYEYFALMHNALLEKASHKLFDNTKIKKALPGWQAKVSIQEGLHELITWLNENNVRKRLHKQLDTTLQKLEQDFVAF